jgi:VIT1/CCC1 family predicted Fe2+/Mn2+ transporter
MKKFISILQSVLKDVAIVFFYFTIAVVVFVVPIYFGWEKQYLFILSFVALVTYITNSVNGK